MVDTTHGRDVSGEERTSMDVVCTDCVPSGKRAVGETAARAVGGTKPSGRALPSIISGSRDTAAEHVAAARAAHPVGSLINVALGGTTRALRSAVAADPYAAVARRSEALRVSRRMASRLETQRAARTGRMDASNPARRIHFPLLHLSVSKFRLAGDKVVRDLAAGMPIGGTVP